MTRRGLNSSQLLQTPQVMRDLKNTTEPRRHNRRIFLWRPDSNFGAEVQIADPVLTTARARASRKWAVYSGADSIAVSKISVLCNGSGLMELVRAIYKRRREEYAVLATADFLEPNLVADHQ